MESVGRDEALTSGECRSERIFFAGGYTRSTSSPAPLSSVAGSASTSPNHIGQSCGSRVIGIRSCSRAIIALAFAVMMVNVRSPFHPATRTLPTARRTPWADGPDPRWPASFALRRKMNKPTLYFRTVLLQPNQEFCRRLVRVLVYWMNFVPGFEVGYMVP
jgi:hypothetical protein